jgi:hypothetical protein
VEVKGKMLPVKIFLVAKLEAGETQLAREATA